MEILEYCSQSELLDKEQFYLNLFQPEYNVLKHAYSLLGFKHSEQTLERLKSKVISDEHKKLLSFTHKGKIVSDETKLKLSKAITNYRKDNPLTLEALENIKNITISREARAVSVLNTSTNEITKFLTQTEAAKFLGVTRQAVYNAVKRGSLLNKTYKIEKK